MQLLIIRHAIAEDRGDFAASGEPDEDRPLTAFGKRRMRRNAEGLRRLAPHLDVLAASPLLRAQQTGRILADEYHTSEIETLEALKPGRKPRELLSWLTRQSQDSVVAVVGHEPHLGTLLTWLVAGVDDSRVTLKKGGVAMLEFSERPAAGRGMLQWLLTPAQLRIIAE